MLVVSAVALAGCAALLGIDDRTLDTSDGSVSASDGNVADANLADGSLGEGSVASDSGSPEVGADAQRAGDGPGRIDAPGASDAGGGSDAGPDGDAQGGGDSQGGGDAQAADAQSAGDAANGGDAQGGGDAQADAPTCADPCPIQTGLNHPLVVVSDTNRVYWTEFGTDQGTADGTVKSCPVAGCEAGPTVYTASQINPRGIAVDGQNVYWGSASYGAVSGAIWSCPIAGCTSPARLASANIPYGVVLDASYVYWCDNNDYTVHRIAKTNGTDTVLYDGGGFIPLAPGLCAVDTAFVYVSDVNNSLSRIPVTGGDPVVMTRGPNGGLFGITIGATDVYFGESGQIASVPKTSDSGTPIASVLNPLGLDLDPAAGMLYWADYGSGAANDGTVGKVGIDGGGMTLLGTRLVTPQGITVSGNSIFWISWGTLDSTTPTGAVANTGVLFRRSK